MSETESTLSTSLAKDNSYGRPAVDQSIHRKSLVYNGGTIQSTHSINSNIYRGVRSVVDGSKLPVITPERRSTLFFFRCPSLPSFVRSWCCCRRRDFCVQNYVFCVWWIWCNETQCRPPLKRRRWKYSDMWVRTILQIDTSPSAMYS